MPFTIAVIGPAQASPDELAAAEEIGRRLGAAGHVVVTGGHGGVMEAASRGAAIADGTVVAILPGPTRAEANPFVSIAVPTGLGELRNGLLVRSADAIICVGGSWGTLSEVALAVRTGVPLVMLHGWDLPPGPILVESPADAVARAVAAAAAAQTVGAP